MLRFGGYLLRFHLASDCGRETINIPEIFSGVHGFMGKTVSLESENGKKVDMQKLSLRFRSQQLLLWKIRGETFSPNLLRFVRRRHTRAHLDGHQHGGRKPAETSVTEFCCEFISRRTQKSNNNTLF